MRRKRRLGGGRPTGAVSASTRQRDDGYVIVELRAVPDCPNVDATRDLLRACLAEAGLPLTVVERVGDYPSPSILVDGRDVTGGDPNGPAACVLSPPTADQIRAALRAPR
jgi:hypothetical protein